MVAKLKTKQRVNGTCMSCEFFKLGPNVCTFTVPRGESVDPNSQCICHLEKYSSEAERVKYEGRY